MDRLIYDLDGIEFVMADSNIIATDVLLLPWLYGITMLIFYGRTLEQNGVIVD